MLASEGFVPGVLSAQDVLLGVVIMFIERSLRLTLALAEAERWRRSMRGSSRGLTSFARNPILSSGGPGSRRLRRRYPLYANADKGPSRRAVGE